tara:strand:+ start:12903 stop:13976 length:1074 start_codon:yes stop_codon:yes gene_type:complete
MSKIIIEEDLDQIHKIVKNKGNWKDATIVITGCAGFLGFYFMHFFARKSNDLGISRIIGLDNFIFNKPSWLSTLEEKYSSIIVLKNFDVSKDKVSEIKNLDKARYVIHAASIASPSYYRKYPIETMNSNIIGLQNLLEYFKNNSNLLGFLFFSSSEVYGDPDLKNIPTDENYRGNVNCTGPRACYDESKRFGETLCWVYADQYKMPITVARPFNNYGPGMRIEDKRLPADFAKNILKGEDIYIFSDGTPKRTFCYISDAIAGYLLCLTYGKYDYFNIGIDKPEIMVKDFAKIYIDLGKKYFNYNGKIKFKKNSDKYYMTDNPSRRCPIINKAKKKLGYNPSVLVQDGVERYLKFLQN